jgi:hypothetical protein
MYDPSLVRARLALVALEAVARNAGSGNINRTVVVSRDNLSEGLAAIRVLAALKKPAQCSGHVAGSTLSVDCHPLSGEALVEHIERAADLRHFLRKLTGSEERDPLILVRGFTSSLTVHRSELEATFAEFDLADGPVGFDVAEAGSGAEAGWSFVLTFAGPVTPEGFFVGNDD